MSKLTTHVLNTSNGVPAAGLRIELRSADTAATMPLKAIRTDAEGRSPMPLLAGDALTPGRYSLTFYAAEYFRSIGAALSDPPFFDEIIIAFGIADPTQNYHVPLLISPWSYSTYRGS